jgi:hypothetical protein
LAEQEIADQHAGLVAPADARRDLPAAHVAFVHHVVVEEGRRVHELDARREADVAVAAVAAERGGGEGEHWPQALAAGRDEVVRDLRDHRDLGARARHDHRVDALHVRGDEADEVADPGSVVRVLVFEGEDDAHARSYGMRPPHSPPSPPLQALGGATSCLRGGASERAA